MSGRVIERVGVTMDDSGHIRHDDRPATFEAAERIAGKRIDRRKNYAIIDGEVCVAMKWTDECSGCFGAGCDECGHGGRKRYSTWVPLWALQDLLDLLQSEQET